MDTSLHDPALHELLEGSADETVAAILRLRDPRQAPLAARLVARFGDIATCRLARGDILTVRADKAVISLKASRLVAPLAEPLDESIPEALPFLDERRPSGLKETGRGVVIGILDWGCDFAHPNLRHEDGCTRLLALWNQRETTRDAANRFGYGRIYTAAEINEALAAADPYKALGYHPASGDPDNNGAHGTHVADIAAGNGRAPGGPQGIAPQADLVFVHLSTWGSGGRANLGDSVGIMEAVDFVREVAAGRPWVINASVGRTGGGHEGLTLVEQGLDQALIAAPGHAIVQSTGNYFNQRMHASARLRSDQSRSFRWEVDAADITPNELEAWYSGRDVLQVDVKSPDGQLSMSVPLGEQALLSWKGREVGHAYHRAAEPNTGDNHIDIFLYSAAPPGIWEITLTGRDIVDGRVHLYVERDALCDGCQSRFAEEDVDPLFTTGTICNGLRTIAVGAYNAHGESPGTLAPFSSAGPTRDGRIKPDCVAPGVRILAARSTPAEGETTSLYTRRSGTSMAAPHVAGAIALIMEAAGPLPIHVTRSLLLNALDEPVPSLQELYRLGAGYLNVEKAVWAAREYANRTSKAHGWASTPELAETRAADQEEIDMEVAQEYQGTEVTAEPDEDEYVELLEYVRAIDSASAVKTTSMAGHVTEDESYKRTELDDFESGEEVLAPTEKMSPGAETVILAEERVTDGASSSSLLASLMGVEVVDPGFLFDALSAGVPEPKRYYERYFEIIGLPGKPLASTLEMGDILLRRALGEGNLAHVAILANGETFDQNEAVHHSAIVERSIPGRYAVVVEGGVKPHHQSDKFARLVFNSEGLTPLDQMILRLRPAAGEQHRTPATPPALPATTAIPDSALADEYIQAHRSRWCTPGQAGSGTCQSMIAPRSISRVVIHTIAVAPGRTLSGVQQVIRNWQRAGRVASAHYLIDRDGHTTQMVREANVAFHTGVRAYNRDSIGFEHADILNDPAPYTTALYERSAVLVRDIARRYGFNLVVHGIDSTVPGTASVIGHDNIPGATHSDPGPYWDWEYYAMLLRWDGHASQERPLRLVRQVTEIENAPSGWQVRERRMIPVAQAAIRNDPYGARYWRGQPDLESLPAVLEMTVEEPGIYKVSLWWPNVSNANTATPVEIEIVHPASSGLPSPAAQTVTVNQRPNFGRWNDVGRNFTITQRGTRVIVRIGRRTTQTGWVLADAVRLLRIGPAPALADETFQSLSWVQPESAAKSSGYQYFPSGAYLPTISGLPEGNGEEYWDPNNTNNPLLDTGSNKRGIKLSDHFTVDELARSGSKRFDVARIDPELVTCLEKIRRAVEKSVFINSGYRSWWHNVAIYKPNTAKKSRHCSGQAADIRVSQMSGLDLAKIAIDACGDNLGLGIADRYLHVDVRGRWACWGYGSRKAEYEREILAYRDQFRQGRTRQERVGKNERDERDWYAAEDSVEAHSPGRKWSRCPSHSAGDAQWAADTASIDYSHLGDVFNSQPFQFSADHLERLCQLNHFNVSDLSDEVLFGLRGCHIVEGHGENFASSVTLAEDVPDHFGYHCVLGIWKRSLHRLAVFDGSTVPSWGHMCLQKTRGGRRANMLPCGQYIYVVGTHRGQTITVPGAFQLQPECDIVVLRSDNNLVYEIGDRWDLCRPGDNIHPGFSPGYAHFSSAGCQTIPGSFVNKRHTGTWATFRRMAGLNPTNNQDKMGRRSYYVLLTGREARLVSKLTNTLTLARLRFGSSGSSVIALQNGLTKAGSNPGRADGVFGPVTAMAYIEWQNKKTADCIVSPVMAQQLGFDLFDPYQLGGMR